MCHYSDCSQEKQFCFSTCGIQQKNFRSKAKYTTITHNFRIRRNLTQTKSYKNFIKLRIVLSSLSIEPFKVLCPWKEQEGRLYLFIYKPLNKKLRYRGFNCWYWSGSHNFWVHTSLCPCNYFCHGRNAAFLCSRIFH